MNSADFFTLFSSGAALVGSAAQSNYAAANAFLDGMGHHLSALAQPALRINWGAIAESGFGGTPEGQKVHEYWESQGIGRISPAQMLAALERLHPNNMPQIAVMNMDWALLFRTHPELARMAALLPFILERAKSLVNASCCCILMPPCETGELVFLAAPEEMMGSSLPIDQDMVGRAICLVPP
jgi:NAD(P)-dependent dehydrogenase (short-subunit alcohol dehydrogenase family)